MSAVREKKFAIFFDRMSNLYHRLFSVEEIEQNLVLQWSFGASLIFFFITYYRWLRSPKLTIEAAQQGLAVCWPYFQNCTDYFFLHDLEHGYSQPLFYMALFAIMFVIVWCMWQKRWAVAHLLLTVLLVWEILGVFVLTYDLAAPYHYYHVVLTAVLLFATHKEFFLKFSFVFMYFMSVTTKFDATWILGTYFTALRDGLPLLPDSLTMPITNFVIFMQTIGCWFLISKRKILQRLSFAYFVAFHLYSVLFVLYFYPTASLPPLLVLFGPLYRYTPIPFSRKTVVGWLIIALLAIFQILGFTAPGDRRMTLEGNKFGMFMFEANHQCIVIVGTHTKKALQQVNWEAESGRPCASFFCMTKITTQNTKDDLTFREIRYESGTAWNRCYPYERWSRYHDQCSKDPDIERISLTMDHSINGGPFYRTVDVSNICDVPYYAWQKNDWIQSPPEAPLIGYPVTNTYN